MIQVTRLENSVLFEFSENQHYLYNGSIEVPYNTLSIIQDGSDMITLRKSASNDIFLSARYNDFGEGSVDAAVDMLADSLFNAEGGGGTGSGITSGEVQTMIDNSLEDYYDKDEVDAALSGKTDKTECLGDARIDTAWSYGSRLITTNADGSGEQTRGYFSKINGYYIANNYSFNTMDFQLVEKSAVTSAITSASTNTEVAGAKAVYDAIQAAGGGGISSGEVQTMIDDSLDDYWTSAETQNAINAATSGIPSSQTIEALRTDVNTISGDVADINDAIAELDDKEQVIASALTQLRDDMDEKEEVVASALTSLNEAIGDPYQKVSGLTIEYNSDSQTPEIMLQGEGDKQRNENVFNRWGIATSAEMEDGGSYSSGLGGGTIYNNASDHPDENVTSERNLEITTDGFRQTTYENYDDGESGYTRYSSENEFNYSNGLTLSQSWYDPKNDETTNSSLNIINNIDGETYIELTDVDENSVKIETTGITINGDAVVTEDQLSGYQPVLSAGTGIEISGNVISATGGSSVTVDATLDSGSTNPVANSAITTAIDNAKAYYISFATIATTGIRDEDWDGIVAAIDDHRPIYAGYPRNDGGILYYGVECMNKNATNTQIILTSSDNSSHYFYTFTKNGSNDYTFTSETKPYVTDAEIATWNAKQDALSAGTGIEISGNVISTTGGGVTVDSTLDTGSTNPVANSAITTAIDAKAELSNTITDVRVYDSLYGRALQKKVGNGGYGAVLYYGLINGTNIVDSSKTSIPNFQLVEKSAITSAITSASTNDEVAGAKAVYDAIQAGGGGGNNVIEVTQAQYDALEQAGTLDLTALYVITDASPVSITVDSSLNSGSTNPVANSAITAAIDTVNDALGGLKLVKLTQAEYDQLATKDANTLYIISNVVS